MLTGFEKTLLAVLVLVLMTGMGATLSLQNFREIAKRPKGLLVGLASQYGWMPLIAFGLAEALSLPPEFAIGLIIVGCTPGGTTSNLFTYYAKADLALSISMTAFSTVVAIIAMPAVLFIYATPFTSEDLVMPYGSIISTLLVVLVPVFIGMVIRKKNLKAARITEKVGSLSGFAVLILLIASSVLQNKHLFATLTIQMYLAAIGLGCFGLLLGYLAALLLGLQEASRRAVSFETGIQNSPLAFAIIIASFSDALQQSILMQPMLYALFVLITSSLVAVVFRATVSRASVAAHSTAA